MVLAFILKSAFPGVTILQFGARNDFRHALREWNDVARWHSKKINGGRIIPPTREKANLQALKFSQVLRGQKSRRLCLTCRGFAVGALCTGVWFLSDILGGPTYQHPLIPVWNAIMLFVFFFVVVWLLTAFRSSHYYLEQTVERRTAALRAEMEERKRLEHAKLQAERLAVVGSMAGQVAHEIRNPLGSIFLNLDLIGEELNVFVNSNRRSAAECQALLREMRSQVLRIRQVLQDYLRFARMPKSERAVVSLKGFLEEKLNFVQPLLDQRRVDLRKTFDPSLPPVYADAEQLWEVLLNLIRNAVDAMPAGGNLTVSTKRNDAEVLVCVSDNGRGMTEDEARNLFVPFFTTKSDGTGLGLAYAQQVINEHGGKIGCATARGKGSTFSIQLPVAVGA